MEDGKVEDRGEGGGMDGSGTDGWGSMDSGMMGDRWVGTEVRQEVMSPQVWRGQLKSHVRAWNVQGGQ